MSRGSGRVVGRVIAAAVSCGALVGALSGCQYLDRTAVRLNSDGTFDVATCETINAVSSANATFYRRTDDETSTVVAAVPTPTVIDEGDIVHFGPTPPLEDWDRVYFDIHGNGGSRISGTYDRSGMHLDKWTWANQGMLMLFADVEHCDLRE